MMPGDPITGVSTLITERARFTLKAGFSHADKNETKPIDKRRSHGNRYCPHEKQRSCRR